MKQLDERGKACPLPVIETKKELERLTSGSILEVLVDNEIAVQNLNKLCTQKGHSFQNETIDRQCFLVRITKSGQELPNTPVDEAWEDCAACTSLGNVKKGLVVVLSSDTMGNGDDTLGHLLMKGFVYALTEQDFVPETVLLYNGGARLSVEGAETLKDLRLLEEQGSEILTCGTCLNHYGLSEKLAVGSATNMYRIAEILTQAGKVVRP